MGVSLNASTNTKKNTLHCNPKTESSTISLTREPFPKAMDTHFTYFMSNHIDTSVWNVEVPDRSMGLFTKKERTNPGFKDYAYSQVTTTINKELLSCCFDSGSPLSAIGQDRYRRYYSHFPKKTMEKDIIKINRVGGGSTEKKEYAVLPLTFKDTFSAQMVTIEGEILIVRDLQCGMIIGNNIIVPYKMEPRYQRAKSDYQDMVKIAGLVALSSH